MAGLPWKDTGRTERTSHGDGSRKRPVPEYGVWLAMRRRCYNQNFAQYADYGGRGISVCDRWRHSYTNFIADMGYRPTPKHTIDRKDNDKDYSPDNCRWVLRVEQANNKRNNRIITAFGRDLTPAQWSKEYGIHGTAIVSRLKCGWAPEDAVSKPYTVRRKKHSTP